MTSSYRDPRVLVPMSYPTEEEIQRKAQEQPNFLDIAGRTALGLGVAALAGAGIRGAMRRNAVRPISVEDLGATGARAEENVRRAARSTATPPPSRPAPPAGVARQQAAEEFTRQARAERPTGIQQVNIEDLGPTFRTPSAAENKATLSWLDNVVLPTEQALTRPRLPGVTQVDLTEFSPRFRSYGQVPQVAKQVVSEVKALPPARTQSTDFLRNQLGSRGYIEQSILDRVAEQSAGDLIDEVTAFSNKEARSELARQGASIQSQERKNLWNLVSEIQNETLVDKQQTRTGFNVDQAINALDAAEDQQTGRVKIQLQRNEDVDLGQVEVLEDIADEQRTWMMEQDEPINRVAAQLPDGRPVDQAEGVDLRTGKRYSTYDEIPPMDPYTFPTVSKTDNPIANAYQNALNRFKPDPESQALVNQQTEQQPQSVANTSAVRFMEAERNKIARELNIDDVPVSPQRIDAELARRLGPQASTYGPKYTARAQALQTFANTGDPIAAETVKRFGLRPVTFETFENMPTAKKRLFESAAPMSLEGYPSTELQTVVDPTGIKVNAPGFGVVDISTLRKPVVMESTARQANEFIEGAKADKLDWVQEKINEINEARQGILLERKERIKTAADNLLVNLEQAKASGQNDVVEELGSQLDNLRTMYRNPELVGDYKEFGEGGMRHLNAQLRGVQRSTNEQIAALEKRYPTTLANRTGEASRVFGELDVNTGEFIPETMEVRSGRSDVDLGRKGGGGRNIAEYTAGERLDEEIRAIQGGGRMRDYDIETGAPIQRWQGDRTNTEPNTIVLSGNKRIPVSTDPSVRTGTYTPKRELGTGRTIGVYGVRRDLDPADNPALKPSQPIYTESEIVDEASRLAALSNDAPFANDYELLREQAVESLGYQQPTPERMASVLLSEQVRKGQVSFPRQSTGPYPSSLLARPVRINFPQETPQQLPLSSNLQQQLATTLRNTPIDQEKVARNQATNRHLANYITTAAQRLEGPETSQSDVRLKGKGQNALRPYQAPSEAMLQQLMRVYR